MDKRIVNNYVRIFILELQSGSNIGLGRCEPGQLMSRSLEQLTLGAVFIFLWCALAGEGMAQTAAYPEPRSTSPTVSTAGETVPLTTPGATTTTTSLTSSGNPSTFGGNLTLTATVSPSAASGSVAFYDGITLLGAGELTGGTATLSTIMLPAGTQPLRAHYLGGGAYSPSTSTVLLQTINAVAGSEFATAVNYGVGRNPNSVASGDFNGDGKADLAITNYSDNTVSILLGKGDGTFQPAANYSTGVLPHSVAVADFNGDGRPDLAIANVGSDSVGVLLGNGDGTFQAQVSYSSAGTNGSGPVLAAVGDFNGDGYADIAAVSANGVTSVYLGKGDGTFAAALNYGTAAAFPATFTIGIGDFNGDGKPDLAVVGYGSLNILLGNGDGTFQSALVTSISAVAWSIAIADLNGDGKTDLAIPTGTEVSVLLGKGDGTFQSPVSYALSNSYGIAIGDFNGDGIPDFVASAFQNGTLAGSATVFLGEGNGAFHAGVGYAVGNAPYALAVGDFDGDGRADIAVANNANTMTNLSTSNSVSVLLGIAGTQVSQTITFPAINNLGLGVLPFPLSAAASSGLTVSFASTTLSVCSVSGPTVTLLTVGTCTIQATQPGNAAYSAATAVNQSFAVSQYSPCDLKQSGSISVADVQLIINEALGVAPQVNDLTGTGVVNVVAVQIEINAALGLGCAAR